MLCWLDRSHMLEKVGIPTSSLVHFQAEWLPHTFLSLRSEWENATKCNIWDSPSSSFGLLYLVYFPHRSSLVFLYLKLILMRFMDSHWRQVATCPYSVALPWMPVSHSLLRPPVAPPCFSIVGMTLPRVLLRKAQSGGNPHMLSPTYLLQTLCFLPWA